VEKEETKIEPLTDTLTKVPDQDDILKESQEINTSKNFNKNIIYERSASMWHRDFLFFEDMHWIVSDCHLNSWSSLIWRMIVRFCSLCSSIVPFLPPLEGVTLSGHGPFISECTRWRITWVGLLGHNIAVMAHKIENPQA
jgi:hypothetical protein